MVHEKTNFSINSMHLHVCGPVWTSMIRWHGKTFFFLMVQGWQIIQLNQQVNKNQHHPLGNVTGILYLKVLQLQPSLPNKLATLRLCNVSTVSSVNSNSRRSLCHCINMAPACRTKGKSVWRRIETQLETEETFWENCQCLCVPVLRGWRYMVKQASVEALRLEY